jgi:hypothetical protein
LENIFSENFNVSEDKKDERPCPHLSKCKDKRILGILSYEILFVPMINNCKILKKKYFVDHACCFQRVIVL